MKNPTVSTRRLSARKLTPLALAAAGVAGLLSARFAFADNSTTYDYTNTGNGNFSDPNDWLEAVPPTTDPNTVLNFAASGSYTAVDDIPLGGPFNLNSINFNVSSTNTVTIGVGATLNTLTFGGTTPATTVSLIGGGSANISTPVYFNGPTAQVTNFTAGTLTLNSLNFSNGSSVTITNAGTGTVTLADAVADYGNGQLNLVNSGGGLFQVGNLGTVSGISTAGISGVVNVSGGAVTFAGNTGGDLFINTVILNVASGASFNFANNGETMGGISGQGNIIQGTAGLTFVAPGNREFDGVISGTGGVTQDVAAVLTLGGQNQYSGTTTIEAGGTILCNAANVLSPNSLLNIVAGAGTLNTGGFSQTVAGFENDGGGFITLTGGTLTSAPVSGVVTFFGGLAGAGNLAVSGPGTQWIDGTSTLTGTTSVTGGTLHENYASLLVSSGITVGPAGTLDVYVTSNVTEGLPMTNTGGLTKSGPATLTFNASSQNQSLAALTVAAGTLVIDHTGDNATSLGTAPALSIGSGFLQVLGNASAANSTTFGGFSPIGAAEIDVTAAGTKTQVVALGAVSRAAGSGGTVNFNPTNANASITTSSVNLTGANTLGGYATYNGSGWAVAGTSGTITALGTYTTGAAGFSTSTLAHADIIANTSVGSGSSAYDVRFNAATTTTLTLSGINTLTDGGILKTPNSGAYASTITGGTSLTAPANQDVIVNQFDTSASLTISAVISNTAGTPNTQTVASLGTGTTITGLTTAGLYVGELVTGSNFGATSNAHIVQILSPTSVLITDALAPTAGTNVAVTFQPETNLVKAGPGTLVMSAKNTFTGVIYLNAGTVNASSTVLSLGSNSSSGSSAVVFNGGTLYAAASENSGSAIQPWIIEPGGATVTVVQGDSVVKEGNSVFGNGSITVNSTGNGTGVFGVGSNGSTFSGPVTINSGVFRFTSNQFTSADGVTISNGGQYQIEDNGVANWNFAPGTTLTLNGNGPSGLATTTPGAFAVTVQSGGGGPTSTFTNPISLATSSLVGVYSNATYPSILNFSGVVSGPGSLTTVGVSTNNNTGGSLTLTNANTYTGGTTVGSTANPGVLFVTNTTGSATGPGPVNVSNGTLAGTGIISGVVTVNPGSTIYAGLVNNPPTGNKSAGVLTIGSGSSLQGSTLLDLTAAPVAPATLGSSDEIVFGSLATPGTAVLGGSLTVTNPNAITFAIGETFDLLAFGSNPGSTDFQSITLPALPTGLAWNDNSLPLNGSISIVSSVQNLTFNNSGGTGDGMTWNSSQQNFYNGSGPSTFNPGDNVTFDDTTANNQYLVVIPGQVAPGSVTVNNSAGNYTFNGSGGITGGTGLVKTGAGTLTINTANTYTGETDVDAGTLVLGTRGVIVGNVVVNTGGTFNLSANTPGGGILVRTMGVLTVNGGGVAAIAPTASHSDRTVLVVGGLNIANVAGATGILDLADNDLDVTSASTSTLSTVTQLLAGGYNLTGGGNWNGTGIISSTAASDTTHLHALGVITNSTAGGQPIFGATTTAGLFDGLSPAASDVLVKYTYVGDANLDGKVDGSDYSLIDAGYASQQPGFAGTVLTGWNNGDFNYDGVIDGSDYALIDNAYNNQGSTLTTPAALVAASTDQVAGPGVAAVPEPASIGMIAAAAMGLAARRRRR